jgi:putative ABC transport system permease protein
MTLVVANAISISVRERRAEIAVMKVLGYRPGQVLNLVLGESLLVGALSGWFAALGSYALINYGLGGIKFPIAFFPVFMIPAWALVWGPAMGCFTALLGSFIPAWTARNVKVSEVFSKVA